MPRSIRIADMLGAAAGVLFAALIFLSVATVSPQRGVSDQELLTWWADSGNRDGFVTSMYLLLLACPLFLVFVSRLHHRLQAADTGGWASMAFASGMIATVALGICAVLRGVVAGSVRFADEPLPGVDTLRFATDLAYAAWNLVMLFMIVLITTVSLIVLTTRVMPGWLGWLGIVVAVGCLAFLAVQSAPFAIPLLILWVIANGGQLLRTPATAPSGERARQPDLSSVQV